MWLIANCEQFIAMSSPFKIDILMGAFLFSGIVIKHVVGFT